MISRVDVEDFIQEYQGDPGLVLASVEALAETQGYPKDAIQRLLNAVVDDMESYHYAPQGP